MILDSQNSHIHIPLGQTSADFVWCLKEMDSQKVLAKCKVKVTGQSAQNHK